MNIWRWIIFALLLSFGNAALAWGDEYFCTVAHLKENKCKEGDLILLLSPIMAMRYCDFSKPVAAFSRGSDGDVAATAVCYFRGEERKER